MLSPEDYKIVLEGPIKRKKVIVNRGIEPSEKIDFSEFGDRISVLIKGPVGEKATISAPCALAVEGNIGYGCELIAGGTFEAHDIDNDVTIKTSGRINVNNVGNRVTLKANQCIKTDNIGSDCHIIASDDSIFTHDVGSNTVIQAFFSVTAKNIAEYARIISNQLEVTVDNVAAHATITAQKNIAFYSLDEKAVIKSQEGDLFIRSGPGGRCFSSYQPKAKDSHGTHVSIKSNSSVSQISVEINGIKLDRLTIEAGNSELGFFSRSDGKETVDSSITAKLPLG